jgi:hypothetical protein
MKQKKNKNVSVGKNTKSSSFLPKILLPATAPHGQAGPRARLQLHGVGTRNDRQRMELERIGNEWIGNLGVAWLVF